MELLKSLTTWCQRKSKWLAGFTLLASLSVAGNFDNLGFNTNTISSRNTNGNIILNPNGTGQVRFNDLTATTVPYLNATKDLVSSAVTPTELAYLSGTHGLPRASVAAGTASHVVINDGSGFLSSEASLAISRGGTGQATAQAAIDALLPAQGSSSGKFLTTNGTTSSWGSPSASASPSTSILDVSDLSAESLTNAYDTVTVHSANGTLELFTCSGNVGRTLRVIHTGTDFNTITLDGSGTETINGSTTYVMYTAKENTYISCSSSTTWIILSHGTETGRVAYTPGNGSGLGTLAAKTGFWSRHGDCMNIDGNVTAGTVAAASTGFLLPGSQTLDTSKLAGNLVDYLGTAIQGVNAGAGNLPDTDYGPMVLTYGTGLGNTMLTLAEDVNGTTVIFALINAVNTFSNGAKFSFHSFCVPITGWNP